MLCVPVSTWLGVYVTEQVLGFGEPPDKRQGLGLKLPSEPKNSTEPNGLVGAVELVSLTVAVHLVPGGPTTTGLGTHDSPIVVASSKTIWVTIAPCTFSGRMFPLATKI